MDDVQRQLGVIIARQLHPKPVASVVHLRRQHRCFAEYNDCAGFLPQPPAVTQTFLLKCLTSEQAASLLRPYLPMPQNPRWQAERYSVTPGSHGLRAFTVGAPGYLIDRVPEFAGAL